MSTVKQYCTFYLGKHCFGVDVLTVQEVIRYQPMTRVPLAPSVIRGLINLRGQIVTAVDLRQRLELPAREDEALPMNVVLRTAEGAVSLLVDEVGDVVDANEEEFERPPETLNGVARALIQGVYKMKNSLLLILNTERAITVAEGATGDPAWRSPR